MRTGAHALRRIALEGLGWLLILGGIAALILPGPGLLMIVGGLALLSQQYEWAQRRLEPVKKRALEAAADGVATWPKIAASTLGALALLALGVVWMLQLDVPGWWPLDDRWWLPGGWGTGASIMVSGLVALALIVYSYRNYREIKSHDPTP
jgi:Putative transmembrane protein (PGPGW)